MSLHHTQNAFLDTSSTVAAAQWDDLLTLQVDLFLPHELDYFAESTAWSAARTVLDVGCGNGYYLSRLRRFHPDKSYVGIDSSAEMIELANERHEAQGLHFEQSDFLSEGAPDCDLILLRFVVQHLSDLGAVLKRAARVLRPGGSVILVEPDFVRSRIAPPVPLFTDLLASFQHQQTKLGRLRGSLGDLAAIVKEAPPWRVVGDSVLSIPDTGPFTGTKTLATFGRWIDLCERAGGFDYPFEQARREIGQWSLAGHTFSRIALRVMHIAQAARHNAQILAGA